MTGALAGLRLHCYLGSYQRDMSDDGVAESQQRYFFHLLCNEDCPATWSHAETHPSGGEHESIMFDLYWLPISEATSVLFADHAQMLDRLLKQEYRRQK